MLGASLQQNTGISAQAVLDWIVGGHFSSLANEPASEKQLKIVIIKTSQKNFERSVDVQGK